MHLHKYELAPKGVEGTYNFDPNGDGVHGYNVVRNVNGKVSFIKHIEFDQ